MADFRQRASELWRERLAELSRTLADGTWEARWWYEPYPTESDVVEIRPDAHLSVLLSIKADESDGMREYADIIDIVDNSLGPET